MPVTLSVHPALGLAFISYSGHAKAAEALDALAQYQQHPDYASGQKHLIDFSNVTSFEGDFTKLMELQAKLLEAFPHDHQVLFVFCAPTPLSQKMAQLSVNAWVGTNKVVTRLLDSEAAAMDVVGLPSMTFANLTRQTA